MTYQAAAVLSFFLSGPLSATVSGFSMGTAPPAATEINPWTEAEIAYVAANEFMREYYDNFGRDESESYFSDDHINEPIYNAREGVLNKDGSVSKPSLTECGFQLVDTILPYDIDWNNLQDVKEKYLPVVKEKIMSVYGEDAIEDIFFWNPTKRHVDYEPTPRNPDELNDPPKASYVGMAHIDTDMNAYSKIFDFLKVVDFSRFPGCDIPKDKIMQALRDGKRYSIVNAWRNIGSTPIQRAPLTFMSTRYLESDKSFPEGTLDYENSRWYTYPNMKPGEMLLLCQFDRDAAVASDLWHCALKNVGLDGPPRDSFDVRTVVIFKDKVAENRDRVSQSQLEPNTEE